jgi:hypothetical protein
VKKANRKVMSKFFFMYFFLLGVKIC